VCSKGVRFCSNTFCYVCSSWFGGDFFYGAVKIVYMFMGVPSDLNNGEFCKINLFSLSACNKSFGKKTSIYFFIKRSGLEIESVKKKVFKRSTVACQDGS